MQGPPIERIAWQAFRLPFRSAFSNSQQTMAVRDGLMVTVEAGGHTGAGEASFLASTGDATLTEAGQIAARLARLLIGERAVEGWDALDGRAEPIGVARTVACAFETALADVAAREAGVGLVAWLEPGRAVSGRIVVNGVIQSEATPAAIVTAVELVREGIRSLKLKVSGDPGAAAAHVAAVRAAVGDAIELRADANGAWSVTEAEIFLHGARESGLALCEEPIRLDTPGRTAALAALRSSAGVRIGVDESCRTVQEFEDAVAAGACDVLVVKPMISGLAETLALMDLARDLGIPVIVTTTFDAGIGTAMAAQVAALRRPPIEACGLHTLGLLVDDLVHELVETAGGALTVPGGPGLGVTLDREGLARFAVPVSGVVSA